MPENEYDLGKVLLFDKPFRWTSFDVVRKVRNVTRSKKVGHAGTLDPLATGLLILCTGRLTKQIDRYQAQEKEYTGTLFLGATTPSFDLETAIDETFDIHGITERQILESAKQFTGEIMQRPPLHSAVNLAGERAYEKARRGESHEVPEKKVLITAFEITGIRLPYLDFRVVCGKGTYIRSLAHDFGQLMDCGAYLSALRRTRIGKFRIEDAWDLDDLIAYIEEGPLAVQP